MTPLQKKTAATTIAALSLVGVLAGCASDTPTTDAGADTGTDSGSTTDGGTASGTYTDGDYSSEGTYTSPDGTEEITVDVTLEGGIITAVSVTGSPDNPDSTRYQESFSSGIADVVVGKNIDEIQVDKVAGSSLTSGGFNAAIDQIKAEALA